MAERKPVFINPTEGLLEEMHQDDSITLGSLTMGGAIAMGGNKITNLEDGVDSKDAATVGQVSAGFNVDKILTAKNSEVVVDYSGNVVRVY